MVGSGISQRVVRFINNLQQQVADANARPTIVVHSQTENRGSGGDESPIRPDHFHQLTTDSLSMKRITCCAVSVAVAVSLSVFVYTASSRNELYYSMGIVRRHSLTISWSTGNCINWLLRHLLSHTTAPDRLIPFAYLASCPYGKFIAWLTIGCISN